MPAWNFHSQACALESRTGREASRRQQAADRHPVYRASCEELDEWPREGGMSIDEEDLG